jgi:hypothetical protein
MSGLMMRAQIGVQKSTGKIRGNWGCQKGVFLRGRRRRAKMGKRVGARDGRDVKKFLDTSVAWWSGTDSILRQTNF